MNATERQTDRPRYGEMCRVYGCRQNRFRCIKRFRLITMTIMIMIF